MNSTFGQPYSIDLDPDGIRARVADAITGAIAFGAQGTHKPPAGHWLESFWDMALAEAKIAPVEVDINTVAAHLAEHGGDFDALVKLVREAAVVKQ